MTDLPASWQPDPTGRHDHRWWSGSAWTDNVADAGVRSKDPYDAPTADVAPEPTVVDSPAGPSVRWDDDDTGVSDPAPTTQAPTPTPASASAPAASGSSASGASASGAEPSRSGRGRLLLGGAVLAAVVVVVAVLAITGDDESSTHSELVASLQDQQPNLSDRDADCVADKVIAAVGEDKVSPEARRSGRYDMEIVDAYATAANECGLTGPGPGSTGTTGSGIGDGSPPSTVDGFPGVGSTTDGMTAEQRLAYYEQTLKLPHDKALCLRDAWVKADAEGTPTNLSALLDPCGVSIEDLTRALNGG